MEATSLTKSLPDTGYTSICHICDARYGEGKVGVRTLKIAYCSACSQRAKDKKLTHLEQWAIRPFQDKITSAEFRKRKAMERVAARGSSGKGSYRGSSSVKKHDTFYPKPQTHD